jgi:hypothetical protein
MKSGADTGKTTWRNPSSSALRIPQGLQVNSSEGQLLTQLGFESASKIMVLRIQGKSLGHAGTKTRCKPGEGPAKNTLRVVALQRGHHEGTFHFTCLSFNFSPVLNHDPVTPHLFFSFIVVGGGKL